MLIADTRALSGVTGYGVMIELAAVKILVMSASVIVVDCATRSESERETIVTLRSTATACDSSPVPKNRAIIAGASIANSTAAAPRVSDRKRPNADCRTRCERRCSIILERPRFVAEGGGRDQQPLVAVEVADVEAEPGHIQRPLIEGAHDDDLSGAAR